MSIIAPIAALTCLWPAPLQQLAGAPPAVSDDVRWYNGPLKAALDRARQEDKLLFVYFWMDGSSHCARVFGDTLQSREGCAELGNLVCYSADAADPEGARMIRSYNVTTLPTMLVLEPDGRVEDAIIGYIPPASFVSEMQRIRQGTQTVGALRRAASADPDDLNQRFLLALKLDFVGDRGGSTALLDSIRAEDPKGKTLGGAELMLYDARQQVTASSSDPNDVQSLDLKPVYKVMPRLRHASVRFKAWSWLATAEQARGDRAKARKAYAASWDSVPATQAASWGVTLVSTFWEMREELGSSERKLALEVALDASGRMQGALDDRDPATVPAEGEHDELEERAVGGLRALACAYAMNRKRKKALETIDRAIEMAPDSEELRGLRKQLSE